MLILFTGVITNVTLILYILRKEPFHLVSEPFSRLFCRLENATLALQFFALLVFFQDLSSQKFSKRFLYFFFFPLLGLMSYYTIGGFYKYISGNHLNTQLDFIIQDYQASYILVCGFFILLLIYRNYRIELIKLLQQHNLTLGLYFALPYFIAKLFESSLFSFTKVNYPAATLTSVLLTGMIYYCFKKLAGFRFLNMRSHVSPSITEQYSFLDDFKHVLARLGSVTHIHEIIPITRDFFYKVFEVPHASLTLHLRDNHHTPRCDCPNEPTPCPTEIADRQLLERVFQPQSEFPEIVTFVQQNKIIIRDEVEFTHYYHDTLQEKQELDSVIDFLKQLNADVFLPIYCDNKLVAYIILDHGARGARFYTDVERDQMLIYCSYIGSMIGLLGSIDIETITQRELALKFDVYKFERKTDLFKECIKGFIDPAKTRKVGVITYKNKKFAYCNQAAKDLLKIDLNKDKGLPFTKQLQEMAQETAVFLSPKRAMITSPQGEALIVIATPNLQRSNTIITVANPGIADYMKDLQGQLKNPEKWPYLLALQVSEEGKLINQLLPSNTATILNCKLQFFEQVLVQKTLLFEMSSEEDALAFAHVAHKTQGRRIFEEITLRHGLDEQTLSVRLFGINPVFQEMQEPSLIEQLNEKGTLFIQNIHLLTIPLQKRLLDFIVRGKFSPMKSDESIESNVLLLFATTQSLQDLVQRGVFLKELYLALQKNAVWLPSLNMLPSEEFFELSERLRQQIVQAKVYQNMLIFSESDKRKILSSGCVSLHELKSKIQNILVHKTRRQSIRDTNVIDPATNVSDLDLVEAARMGRHALKDPKMLALLLAKFQNNQNKVALFLGVNRSTVNRRCIQHGLDVEPRRGKQEQAHI